MVQFKSLMALAIATALTATGCATTGTTASSHQTSAQVAAKFEADRKAILAMTGNYRVSFDFIETASFQKDYKIKDRKLSGGDEIVRVVTDEGDFISLQHILVVGGEDKFPVKHWRQDWRYEPASVLVYKGGNVWETRQLSAAEAAGKWSQVVYQVDDAPRYGAVGAWTHGEGISEWTPPSEWRPLPRRDATTRDDYHTVDAVNRHTITPHGWVHEQDNTKVMLTGGQPEALVREIAINTYKTFDDFETEVGDNYFAKTGAYWAAIRKEWARIEAAHPTFGLTIQGEPEAMYMPILGIASQVESGDISVDDAVAEAKAHIAEYLTTTPAPLADRIANYPSLDD